MNPIWIKEYTLCVAVSGDHRGTAGNLSECPAYSLTYMVSANGYLMPIKKAQVPPDLRYFNATRK